MTNDVLQLATDASKGSYEKLQELNELNYKTFEKLTEFQLSLFNLGLENTVEQVKLLSEFDNYPNLVTVETEVVNGYRDKLISLTQDAGQFISKSSEEYVDWAGKYFSVGQAATGTAKVQKKTANKKRSTAKKAA